MVVEHHVEGYDNFLQLVNDLKVDGAIIVIFSGSNTAQGQSWCSDCVVAAPAIERGLKEFAPDSTHIIHVQVGNREYWKDLKCPFRVKTPFLKVLPSIVRWGTQARLEGDDCEKSELIEMLFESDVN